MTVSSQFKGERFFEWMSVLWRMELQGTVTVGRLWMSSSLPCVARRDCASIFGKHSGPPWPAPKSWWLSPITWGEERGFFRLWHSAASGCDHPCLLCLEKIKKTKNKKFKEQKIKPAASNVDVTVSSQLHQYLMRRV